MGIIIGGALLVLAAIALVLALSLGYAVESIGLLRVLLFVLAAVLAVAGSAFVRVGMKARRSLTPSVAQVLPATAPEPVPAITEVRTVPAPQLVTPPQPEAEQEALFDEAPPELADMTLASLRASLDGFTNAQIHQLMEQHRGKPVRVSGEVEHVAFGVSIPSVRLKKPSPFLLFFDVKGHDAKPELLTLNEGDKIAVSGQFHSVDRSTILDVVAVVVGLDKCKLIDARRAS